MSIQRIRYHSQESMKPPASKGRSRCHTPASVHGIYFMPFEADLFMTSTQYRIRTIYFHLYSRIDLSIYPSEHWGWGLDGCYLAKVEVEMLQSPIPLPTSISKISSKNIIFVNKMNNKYIYDSKNSIAWRRRRRSCLRDGVPESRSSLRDGMPSSGSWLRAAVRLLILAAGGGAALDPISL